MYAIRSYYDSSYDTPSSSPVPFLIAREMLSLGIFTARAAVIADRSREFPSGSPPPILAAARITSYNVCYTKILRARFFTAGQGGAGEAPGAVDQIGPQALGGQQDDRDDQLV